MTTATTLDDLQSRLGSVPPVNTEKRREWLIMLTAYELRSIAGTHGIDLMVNQDCWGWGATAAGLPDGDNPPRCTTCNRKTHAPLWFYTPDREVSARCWSCALIDHLVGCKHWPDDGEPANPYPWLGA